MVGLIKEIPSVRVIDFMGAKVTFVPHAGTYWVSREDIKAATGVDVGSAQAFAVQCPKWYDRPKSDIVEHLESLFKIGASYSLRSAELALRCSLVKSSHLENCVAFIGLLAVMPGTLVSNVTSPALDDGRLRALLDRHPHWLDILQMWNGGKTEGQIASALDLRVTQVRSAVLQMREHGFDLMRKRMRISMKWPLR